MRFYYIYKALAHWGYEGYVGPVTLHERLIHIQEGKRTLGTEINWLSDTMANDLKHLIGDASNSEFVLDPEGRILKMRLWSDPQALREDLAALVGAVVPPTKVDDLNMKVEPPPQAAPTGIVERIKLPGVFHPLQSQPQLGRTELPFYVKLRAAASNELFQTGRGRMYLGFFLDPIYNVHWNNEKDSVRYEISAPPGMTITPATGQGPVVEAPADADPREFILDVEHTASPEPLQVRFFYYGCTDLWCVPVTQEYLVTWDMDRDSGWQFGNGEIDPRMLEQYPE